VLKKFTAIFTFILIIPLTLLFFNPGNLYAEDIEIEHKGSITGAGAPNYLWAAVGVYVSGSYAYVASRADCALVIFDVSDPANPALKGEIHGAGAPNYLGGARGVYISGSYAYVTGSRDNSLVIFNVSDPANPVLKAEIHGAGAPNYLRFAMGVYVSGSYAYVASYADFALSIFSITALGSDGTAATTEEEKPKPRVYEKSPRGFVIYFYNKLLIREPEDEARDIWLDMLANGNLTGSMLVYKIAISKECKEVVTDKFTDSEFINFLYKAILNRDPEEFGYNTWMALLAGGMSRDEIIYLFVQSEELERVCNPFKVTTH
jgi:hypothetical protein